MCACIRCVSMGVCAVCACECMHVCVYVVRVHGCVGGEAVLPLDPTRWAQGLSSLEENCPALTCLKQTAWCPLDPQGQEGDTE